MQTQAKKADPVPPPEYRSERIDSMGETELAAVLRAPASTVFEKAKACQRLAVVGTASSVPAVAPLLSDVQLSTYARHALQAIPGPASDEALRAAVPKLRGTLLVGVLNSLGHRRDKTAVPMLAKLLGSPDAPVAQASAAALGHVSGPEAARVLRGALARTKGPLRTAVADACLICAEGLLASGDRAAALSMYNALSAPDVPKPMRLAAMHAIIAAETSLQRPRVAPTAAKS